MPHASLKLLPGVDQNRTPALNEAGISESNLVRFIPDRQNIGLVQKLGGWTKFYPNNIGSIVRCLWAWEDTNDQDYLAVGATASLSYILNGQQRIITPRSRTDNVAVDVDATSGSDVFVINDTGSNITSFDYVYIPVHISVGGVVLFGIYQCTAIGPNQFSIRATDILGAPQAATFTTDDSITVTGASGTGTVATLTYGDTYTFPINSAIKVSSVNPAGYNGTYIVTACTPNTSVSYASTETGAYVSGGIISNNGVVPLLRTTTGSPFVNVVLPNHGLSVGDTFPILVSTTIGGIPFYGNYIVQSVANSYTFEIASNYSANATTSGYINGGDARYVFWASISPQPFGTGYGVGGYGVGGYGSGVGIAPTIGTITAVDWTLDNWGEILIASPLGGPIFQWSPSAGNDNLTIISNAPIINQGIFVAMPQRQIVAWGSTFTGISDPLLIRWCDVNNYDVWVGTVTNQAGSYRIPKGSRIVQCIQGPQQGLIWTDLGVWAMQYVGPPYVYQFNELGNGCGLIGRKAAASMNGIVYWMGQSQFYRLAGAGVETIRCPVWDVIFQDLDTTNLDKIRVAPNSRFGEIAWFYPTIGNGGEPNKYVKYNIVLNEWDYGTLERTAWINESVFGPPIGAGPLPGGSGNYIVQHETSPDGVDVNGNPVAINSSFQTGYFVMNEADLKMFVDQVWPDMKWGYFGGTQDAQVNLTFYVNDYAGQTPIPYGPFPMTQNTTFLTPRFRGRLVSIKMESNDVGSFWRIGNMRYRLQPDGKF